LLTLARGGIGRCRLCSCLGPLRGVHDEQVLAVARDHLRVAVAAGDLVFLDRGPIAGGGESSSLSKWVWYRRLVAEVTSGALSGSRPAAIKSGLMP
jgi:hypothetical protein